MVALMNFKVLYLKSLRLQRFKFYGEFCSTLWQMKEKTNSIKIYLKIGMFWAVSVAYSVCLKGTNLKDTEEIYFY